MTYSPGLAEIDTGGAARRTASAGAPNYRQSGPRQGRAELARRAGESGAERRRSASLRSETQKHAPDSGAARQTVLRAGKPVKRPRTIPAKARSDAYAMLAIGFGYPGEDLFQGMSDGVFANALSAIVQRAHPALRDDLARLAPQLVAHTRSLEEQEAEYLRVFETGRSKPPVSFYETGYSGAAARARIIPELKALYRRFGLAADAEVHDVVDSLTAELEFMELLAANEWKASNRELRPEPYRLAQRDFLDRHLARWLPKMMEAASGCQSSFYRALAAVASLFVTADLHHVTRLIEEQAVPASA